MRLEILDEHHFLESPLFTHSWDLFKQEQSSIISTRNITPISQFADSIRKVDTCHDRLYYQHVPTQDVSQAIQSNKGDMKYYELNIFLCHIGNTILQQYGTQDSKVACLFLELLIVDSNTMRHINSIIIMFMQKLHYFLFMLFYTYLVLTMNVTMVNTERRKR